MIQQFPLAGTTTSFYVTFFSSFFKIFFQEHYYICSRALSFSYSLKLSYLYPIRMHLTFCINSSPHLTHFQPIKTKIIAFDISASLLATNCTMHIHLQPWHPFYHSMRPFMEFRPMYNCLFYKSNELWKAKGWYKHCLHKRVSIELVQR